MSDYTQTPTKLRIVRDDGMIGLADEGARPNVWQLDAIDTRTAKPGGENGRMRYEYTEQVWNFPTFPDAVAAMPDFVGQLSEYLPDVRVALLLKETPCTCPTCAPCTPR